MGKKDKKFVGDPAKYEWDARAKLFREKTRGRFIAMHQAADIGLIPPADSKLETPVKPERKLLAAPGPEKTIEVQSTVMPAPSTSQPQPDTKIFPESPPPPQEQKPGDAPDPNGPTPQTEAPMPNNNPQPEIKIDNRILATLVWGAILNLLSVIFGAVVFPRDAAEQEPVLVSWVMYLDSLGIKPLTPLMGVILSMCLYFLPRLTHMIEAAKEKFKKKPSAANRGEPEPMKSAAPGPEKTPGPKTEPPQPPPAPPTANKPAGTIPPFASLD